MLTDRIISDPDPVDADWKVLEAVSSGQQFEAADDGRATPVVSVIL